MTTSTLIHYVVIFSSLFRLHTCWSNWILATSGNLMKFQYKFQQTAGRYYISPQTDILWSWTTYQELTGTYYYTSNNGATWNTFQCNGGEAGSYGVGCSNGGGPTHKVLPMNYNNDYSPGSGLAQICQDQPGIFSDDPGDHPCQTEIDVFFKYCSDALGCSGWILATSSNLDIRFQYKFQQTVGRYYISPHSHYLWSWNRYQEQTGTYYYTINNGATWNTFQCNGGESGKYGVGCSNGGGATQKVLPMDYNNDYDPSSGLAQICQDQPGIFSDDPGDHPCQTEIDVFFSFSSAVLGGEIIPEFGPIDPFDDTISHNFINLGKFNKYVPYKDVIIMVSLFMNVILITVCCWFICSKRNNNKKEYKLVNMQTDLSETDDVN